MRNKHYYILTVVVAVFCQLSVISLSAAAGDLDMTFSGDGKLTDQAGAARAVALQPDGKIVVAGTDASNGAFALARYNTDGSPDTTYGRGDGKVTTDIGFTNEGATAVILQPDGKIVAVGTLWDSSGRQWGYFALIRYNPDGSLDLTFGGGDGIVVTEDLGTGWVSANSAVLQADGKIVVAGRTDYYLYDFPELTIIRYNPDGTLDLPFGGGSGQVKMGWSPGPFGGYAPAVEDGTAIAIQPDGKLVVSGYSYGFWDLAALARLNSNGSLDSAFGANGVSFTDIGPGPDPANCIAIQPDGKIVTAGSSSDGSKDAFALVRYNSNGSLDTTFDSDGKVVSAIGSGRAWVRSIAVQSDGKILVAGGSGDGPTREFALARYNANGSLDTDFGGDGDGMTIVDFKGSSKEAYGMALDRQGRAVVVGEANGAFAVARLILGEGAVFPYHPRFDFDGDGRSDLSVFRPDNSVWYFDRSTEGFGVVQFGVATDRIVPRDYDGDGKTDVAVYRDGVWWRMNSRTSTVEATQFGVAGDIPVPADYTGDGRDELAIYRNGQWWSLELSDGKVVVTNFGFGTDKPVPADYDGDGKADIAIYRDGAWWIISSGSGAVDVRQFGRPSDRPVVGDYDGDSRADLAVYRDGTWDLLQSSNGPATFSFGTASDIPTPADYDGDGRMDAAVYRNGTWYLRKSSGGILVQQFGLANDRPAPAAFLP